MQLLFYKRSTTLNQIPWKSETYWAGNRFRVLIRRLWTAPSSLTLHVVGFERLANVQHGSAQQHVRLEGLVAPHAEHQLAEGGHNPAGGGGGGKGRNETRDTATR